MKKILMSLIISIFFIIIYVVCFSGTKTLPSTLNIQQINKIYHTSFPNNIEKSSIGELIDKSLFDKKEPIHVVILVNDYYFCEFKMTKDHCFDLSENSDYMKDEFMIYVENIPIKIKQYDYSTLNTEDTYKPTYILTFKYQNSLFHVTLRSISSSIFTYQQDEKIKNEELNYIKDFIRKNIFSS